MSRIVLLDSAPLGLISNPKVSPETQACRAWVKTLVAAGIVVVVPEIADYEVRRELLRARKTGGVARLDLVKASLDYAPITTAAMLKAAELWARARQMGRPTASDHALDGDMILAAQASVLADDGHDVTVATTNISHLAIFIPAQHWRDIS